MRILLGLLVIVTLALLVSSRSLWGLRRSPLGAALITGGYLTIGLGFLLGPYAIRLVVPETVLVIRPLILFCLGWVGFMVGLQAHRRILRMLPIHVPLIAFVDAVLSILLIGLGAYFVFGFFFDDLPAALVFLLALLPATFAIGWSPEVRSLRAERSTEPQATYMENLLRGISGVGSILAILIYGLLFKFARAGGLGFPTIWEMVFGLAFSLLIAFTLGLMSLWLMRVARRSEPEFLVVLLGTVAFTAGAAATLGFSPLFVGMLCGAVILNMPGETMARFERVTIESEQPVAMALMLVAGLLLDPAIGTVGLALVAAILLARAAAKLTITPFWLQRLSQSSHRSPLRVGPFRQSPLAIALAVGVAASPLNELLAPAFSGQQLLTVVILTGLLADAVPLLYRLIRPQSNQQAPEVES